MNMWLALVLLVLPFIMSSCGMGRENAIPAVAISKHFPSMDKSSHIIVNSPEYAWWKQFHSKELNQLVIDGLNCNPDIQIALAHLEQARGELQQVKLSWIPILNLYGGYSTNPALGIPGGFYGVWPYYALNIMQLHAKQKKMQYNLSYQRAQVDGVRLLLIGQIASAYFTLLAEQEQLQLLNQLSADLKRLISLSRNDIKIGLNNDIDLATLQVQEKLIEAQRKPIEHNIVVSQNALRFLVGRNPGKINTKKSLRTFNFSRFKPGNLPATVLNNRPDVKMAKFAIMRDRVGITEAFGQFFPKLQLDDFIGEAHLPTSQFAQATDAYLTSSLAPSTFGFVQSRKGKYQTSVAEYIKTVRQVLQAVDNDFSANKKANEQYKANKKAEQTYQHKYDLQKGLYQTGLMSYKEVLGNKIYLDELALTTNQTKLQQALSLVLLYQDLAGGYNEVG